jgi:hypothetical protein
MLTKPFSARGWQSSALNESGQMLEVANMEGSCASSKLLRGPTPDELGKRVSRSGR